MEWTGRLLVGVSRSALSTTRRLLDRTWVYAGAACWLLLGFKQSTICRGKQGPAPLSGARYWLHLHPPLITAPVRRCVAWRGVCDELTGPAAELCTRPKAATLALLARVAEWSGGPESCPGTRLRFFLLAREGLSRLGRGTGDPTPVAELSRQPREMIQTALVSTQQHPRCRIAYVCIHAHAHVHHSLFPADLYAPPTT